MDIRRTAETIEANMPTDTSTAIPQYLSHHKCKENGLIIIKTHERNTFSEHILFYETLDLQIFITASRPTCNILHVG